MNILLVGCDLDHPGYTVRFVPAVAVKIINGELPARGLFAERASRTRCYERSNSLRARRDVPCVTSRR